MTLSLAQAVRDGLKEGEMVIPFMRYRMAFRVTSPVTLPEYSGSAIRGAFGRSLRRVCCMTHQNNCKSCPLYRSCPYTMIFETPPPMEHPLQAFSQIPNAYVIEPPTWGSRNYGVGEELSFHVVLCGRAIGYLSLVVYAMQKAFEFNIGKGNAELTGVFSVTEDGEKFIYDQQCERILPHGKATAITIPDTDSLAISVQTPLRIQINGSMLGPDNFSVHTLMMALVRRVALLHEFQCSESLELDFQNLAERSHMVKAEMDLQLRDWIRYSSRQQNRMHLGGVVGTILLTNLPREIVALWKIAEYSHVGKNATFGLGKVAISTVRQ